MPSQQVISCNKEGEDLIGYQMRYMTDWYDTSDPEDCSYYKCLLGTIKEYHEDDDDYLVEWRHDNNPDRIVDEDWLEYFDVIYNLIGKQFTGIGGNLDEEIRL